MKNDENQNRDGVATESNLTALLEEMRACEGGMCSHCIELLCDDILPLAESCETAFDAAIQRAAAAIADWYATIIECPVRKSERMVIADIIRRELAEKEHK